MDLLAEWYMMVDRIKLESLGDHSTRSTSTEDYSTGFSKEEPCSILSSYISISTLSK
jgi:hypothetical protein